MKSPDQILLAGKEAPFALESMIEMFNESSDSLGSTFLAGKYTGVVAPCKKENSVVVDTHQHPSRRSRYTDNINETERTSSSILQDEEEPAHLLRMPNARTKRTHRRRRRQQQPTILQQHACGVTTSLLFDLAQLRFDESPSSSLSAGSNTIIRSSGGYYDSDCDSVDSIQLTKKRVGRRRRNTGRGAGATIRNTPPSCE